MNRISSVDLEKALVDSIALAKALKAVSTAVKPQPQPEPSKQTMKVIEPNEPITVSHVALLIYGDPGAGKSTIANTAKDPIVLDFDRGAHRAHNRRRVIQPDNIAEAIAWLEAHRAEFGDVVIDTAGRMLDMMAVEIMRDEPKRGKNGALDMQGWGILKTRFVTFRNRVTSLGKDLILLAHAKEEKDGDTRLVRPDIQGGSLAEVLKASEFVGYLTTTGGKRVVNFSPTDQSIGKNPCQWEPFAIPHYSASPAFLADLLADGKAKLGQIGEEATKLDQEIASWRARLDEASDAESLTGMMQALAKSAPSATLKAAAWSLFLLRGKAVGAKFDSKAKVFVADEKAAA